jgi:hypothetical protein
MAPGTGAFGWPHPFDTNVDVLGYDAGRLQRHATFSSSRSPASK